MTGFTARGYANNFQIQVQTDNPVVFAMIEDYIRRCLDWETGQQIAQGMKDGVPVLEDRRAAW